MEVVLVGEMNPYGMDPKYALFDLPKNAAGYRLRTRVLQVERRTYFGFKRHNLCVGKWSKADARREAGRLYLEVYDSRRVGAVFVLLGRKVSDAFGWMAQDPFTRDGRIVFLPHPSGLCRLWNTEGAYDRAQAVLREAAPDVPWGETATFPRTSASRPP